MPKKNEELTLTRARGRCSSDHTERMSYHSESAVPQEPLVFLQADSRGCFPPRLPGEKENRREFNSDVWSSPLLRCVHPVLQLLGKTRARGEGRSAERLWPFQFFNLCYWSLQQPAANWRRRETRAANRFGVELLSTPEQKNQSCPLLESQITCG